MGVQLLSIKQTQAFISTYAADVSGVCSALFELGGMCVMHDASGCNSTYNTHDEPRWYDHDSLVFISALSELEAVMGDDEKLIRDITSAARELSPRFIAIAGTPIPMMSGCDLPAVASVIEARTGIPCFGFPTNGMHSYITGAGAALAAYAERFVGEHTRGARGVNILGATPLDFSVNGTVDSIKKVLYDNGFKVISSWAMGSTPDELERASAASVNLVVSSAGLECARVLYRRFGTPYVTGVPYGPFSEQVCAALKKAAGDGVPYSAFADYASPQDAGTVVIGESVMARSYAAARHLALGEDVRVVCPLEASDGLLSPDDIAASEEDDIRAAIAGAQVVVADPLYRPIAPADADFVPLPHEAFSGRIFRRSIPDLVKNFEI